MTRRASDQSELFARFVANPRLPIPLQLAVDDFSEALAAIRARRVTVRLDGVPEDAELEMVLTHTGRSVLRHPRTGELRVFTHEPRAVVLYQGVAPDLEIPAEDNLGGSPGEYSYLSPVAVWTLRVTTKNASTILKDLRAIRFTFNLFGYARLDANA